MRDPSDDAPSFAFGGTLLVASFAFFLTKSTWFDNWPVSDKINFFVAAGTMGLAAITTASVWITARVVKDEQVRHQQGFAPLLKLDPPSNRYVFGGFTALNVGTGIAQNIRIRASITYTHLVSQAAPQIGNVKIPTGYGGTMPVQSTEQRRYAFSIRISAIAQGQQEFVEDRALTDLEIRDVRGWDGF